MELWCEMNNGVPVRRVPMLQKGEREMDIKLNVVRFRSTDVIATSGPTEFCDLYGVRHYIFNELVDPQNRVYSGMNYQYTAENGLVAVSPTSFRDSANEGIEIGKVYYRYYDGVYTHAILCENQSHGQ